jgi:hypothetical protein
MRVMETNLPKAVLRIVRAMCSPSAQREFLVQRLIKSKMTAIPSNPNGKQSVAGEWNVQKTWLCFP